MKQLNLNQLRLVRGAEGGGGGDGVIPPKTRTYSRAESGSGGGGGVEPPKVNVAP